MKEFNDLKQQWDNAWISEGISQKTTEWCSDFGEYLANVKVESYVDNRGNSKQKRTNALTTSQLRKFFGELRRIDADFENKKDDFIMMNPILAYAIGRDEKKTKIGDFGKILTPAITYVGTDEKRFKNFVKIFEAIVAYHKFHGGK